MADSLEGRQASLGIAGAALALFAGCILRDAAITASLTLLADAAALTSRVTGSTHRRGSANEGSRGKRESSKQDLHNSPPLDLRHAPT